jgi:6-phosphogluconolactonase/glucosamine-6-phosphate isomerase/deaminase
MKIHTSTIPAQDAARHLNTVLAEHAGADILLLLSGGSAFALLEDVDTTSLSDRVTISVLDERYTHDDAASNFSQLTRTAFWERAAKQHVQAIDPRPRENENLVDAAKRFDLALKHWHIINRDGVVIVTMGIGGDGHTAGILPFPHNPETFNEYFNNAHRCVAGYHVDPRVNPHTDRMTTTLTYLTRHVHHAVVYAVGEEKRAALTRADAATGSLNETPARILRDMPDVHIYTDITL